MKLLRGEQDGLAPLGRRTPSLRSGAGPLAAFAAGLAGLSGAQGEAERVPFTAPARDP